tara:strand:- start:152 stop:499 length:348 start_codon:yes stop_codon:yes gene_type:complete
MSLGDLDPQSGLDIQILGRGNYKPSLLNADGLKLIQIEYRTRSEKTWIAGQKKVIAYIKAIPEEATRNILMATYDSWDDPLSIALGKGDNEHYLDDLALQLEKMGFYGKAAAYSE